MKSFLHHPYACLFPCLAFVNPKHAEAYCRAHGAFANYDFKPTFQCGGKTYLLHGQVPGKFGTSMINMFKENRKRWDNLHSTESPMSPEAYNVCLLVEGVGRVNYAGCEHDCYVAWGRVNGEAMRERSINFDGIRGIYTMRSAAGVIYTKVADPFCFEFKIHDNHMGKDDMISVSPVPAAKHPALVGKARVAFGKCVGS